MPDQDEPAEKIDQHKSLEETMREDLVSEFVEGLRTSNQITADQVEQIKTLLSQGHVSSQAILKALSASNEADTNG